MSQAPKSDKTRIWGAIKGANYANLYISALGDLREGCDSVGEVANPFVSENGTPLPYHKNAFNKRAPGDLGKIGEGRLDLVVPNLDLSGTHSVIGRGVYVAVPTYDGEKRLACCTIGYASGKKQQSYGGQRHGGHGGHGGYY